MEVEGVGNRRSHIFIRDVPSFDPLSCPGRFAEKGEAGFHARVVEETTDRDAFSHLGPAILLDQFRNDGLKRDPVQGIAGVRGVHVRMVIGIRLTVADRKHIAQSMTEARMVCSEEAVHVDVSGVGRMTRDALRMTQRMGTLPAVAQ